MSLSLSLSLSLSPLALIHVAKIAQIDKRQQNITPKCREKKAGGRRCSPLGGGIRRPPGLAQAG